MASQVIITEMDRERLQKVIIDASSHEGVPYQAIQTLEREIGCAKIVEAKQLSPKVITMHSRVLLELDGEDMEVSLVYPAEADWVGNKLSVLSPIGMAILGYSEGDRIQWDVPSGVTFIQIKKVLYQPEAAGDFES